MPRRLLINADDFGLTSGVDRAIGELHEAGVLRSATLMATGQAFADAVTCAQQHPGLGVGCHVVLTDGVPVSAPASIPSLTDPEDRTRLRPALLNFIAAVLLGRVSESEMANEAEAQIRKLQNAGLMVTHVDTHKHTHVFPPVTRALLQAMERTGVRAMRNPFEPRWSLRIGTASRLRRAQVMVSGLLLPRFQQLPALRERRVLTTDGTIGVSATGHLDAAALRSLLEHMPEGTWELVCHPGYNDRDLDQVATRLRSTRDVERTALLDVLDRDESRGARTFDLVHFGDLEAQQ